MNRDKIDYGRLGRLTSAGLLKCVKCGGRRFAFVKSTLNGFIAECKNNKCRYRRYIDRNTSSTEGQR